MSVAPGGAADDEDKQRHQHRRPVEIMRTVGVRGQHLRVSIRPGRNDRPPLVLCNGIGAGLEVLQPVVDALGSIEVVRFDVPGVGGSSTVPIPYGFPGMAWLVAGMMRKLGYEEFDVLGLSWGGALAQQLALQHRRRVRRVVLVATGTGLLMVPGRPRVLAKLVTPKRFRDPDYAAQITSTIYGGTARGNPQLVRYLMGDSMRLGSGLGYLHQLAAGATWTSLPCLPLLRQRTLILHGDDDPIVPLINARMMRALIPRSKLHIYHGGHVALVTEADELGPLVERFLTAVD